MRVDSSKPPRVALAHIERTEDFLATLEDAYDVADPAERAATYTRYLTATADVVEYLSACRMEALRQWRRQGASYDEVARRLGVSKSRAQQLCVGMPRGSD